MVKAVSPRSGFAAGRRDLTEEMAALASKSDASSEFDPKLSPFGLDRPVTRSFSCHTADMALFRRRLHGAGIVVSKPAPAAFDSRPSWMIDGLIVALQDGYETLEVVGESHYQDNLWIVVGGRSAERVSHAVHAILVAEESNPYDPNSIAVWIYGLLVGRLSRENATLYRAGLLRIQATEGKPVALSGVVAGGGPRPGGIGMLGVFLKHDPVDFGVLSTHAPPELRTGFSEAHLDWYAQIPEDGLQAMTTLRRLLAQRTDPVDRHFLFAELESRLYKSRDIFVSALSDYDAVCADHDAEMTAIRPALVGSLGAVPLLETYKQMAVRHRKAGNWMEGLRWAERGLVLYGDEASNDEWADDLRKRAEHFQAKLSPAPRPPRVRTPTAELVPEMETLLCSACGGTFVRVRSRGRKPLRCPACVVSAA